MPTDNDNQSLREDREEQPNDPAMLGKAVGQIYEILMNLPSKERLPTLKAVGGALGHRVLPGLGLQRGPNVPYIGQRTRSPAVNKSHKTAEQLEIEASIKSQNALIKEKSERTGQRLGAEDPLISERNSLFRRLQSVKTRDESKETQ